MVIKMHISYKISVPVFGALMLALAACGRQAPALYDSPQNPIEVTVNGSRYRVERYAVQGPGREITALNSKGERLVLNDANGDDRLVPANDSIEEIRYGSTLRCEPGRAVQTLEGGRQQNAYNFADNTQLTRNVQARCEELMRRYDADFPLLRQRTETGISRR